MVFMMHLQNLTQEEVFPNILFTLFKAFSEVDLLIWIFITS